MDDFIKAMASGPRDVAEDFRKEAKEAQKTGLAPNEEDGFSFLDVLDIINPLQHIPVISTLYREATGDKLGPLARIAGGALFGGPIGAASSAVNAMVEYASGKDIGGHVYALLNEEDRPPEAEFQTAADAPFEPPAAGSLSVPKVAREDLPPPPTAPVAAATPAEGTDPIQAWAQAEVKDRTRQTMGGMEGASAEDPVTVWARQEQVIRTAAGRREGIPGNDPLADRDRLDPKKVAGLATDSGVLAALQVAHRETDTGQAALRESLDLGRQGRQDRATEATVGAMELGSYRWADLLAQARHPSVMMDG